MSLYNSLKKIKNKIYQKNFMILENNIYDFFPIYKEWLPHEFSENTSFEENKSIINLSQYLEIILDNMGYTSIIKYSPLYGKKHLKGELEAKNDQSSNDEFQFEQDEVNSQATINIVDFLNEDVIYNIKRRDSDIAYIIDLMDLQFGEKNPSLDLELVSQLLDSFLQLGAKKRLNALNLTSNRDIKVILLVRDSGLLSSSLSQNNVEYENIAILNPDNHERSRFLIDYSAFFNVNDSNNLSNKDSKEHQLAVSLTNGMSYREIIQLAKIKLNSKLTFKELYLLATKNDKESPWEKIDSNKIKDINKLLSDRVKGQNFAIDKVKQNLIKSILGLNGILHSENLTKPKGTMFFCGPTGVGKTELAKAITELVFGDESKLIRFDMSEYSQENSDQRMIGSPPGYVGYDSGGQLTNEIKKNPFSVLLFDEIEKAHPSILDKFLQILEDGRLTSSKGELIDFSETFIIFTSNIGQSHTNPDESEEITRKKFIEQVEIHFKEKLNRPEILNRIGRENIVSFNYINDHEIQFKLVQSKIDKLNTKLLKDKKIKIHIDESNLLSLFQLIISPKNFDTKMGGRGLINSLENIYINALSDFLFDNFENYKNKVEVTNINLKIDSNKITFSEISI